MADELPDTIVYECPDCRDTTEHKILKARLGNSNVTGTFRCTECGRVFTGTIRLPKPLTVKVMVSTADTTDSTETVLLESEILEVGDEFQLDDGRNVCITQIIDKGMSNKRKKCQATEIKELWVKDYDVLQVKVSVNDNTRTYPMYTEAEPDDEFAVGMMMHFDKWDAVITTIKTKEKLLRRGSAEARDISRIYAKIVRHGQTESEDGSFEEFSDEAVMDFDDE
ncbi:putative archaeal Zn-finger protein [Thermoplasmatales archaeon BRNA1]|nr:putative archaeal Zn-finger protein [Thermoplasmatales archaeon BRNA1]